MSDFKAKMHKNRFRLRLRPRPRWGSLQRSPRPIAVFKGPTSKGKEGEGKERREKETTLHTPCRKIPGYATASAA